MARKKLHKLSDLHLAAIRLKIEGQTCRQIAEALGVELRTVHLWFSDPLVKGELAKQREHIVEIFAERMADVGLRAIALLEETAELALDTETLTVEQRIEVVSQILDRIPLTARRNQANSGRGDGTDVPDMPDEEFVTRFRRLAGMLPEGVADDAVDAVVVS